MSSVTRAAHDTAHRLCHGQCTVITLSDESNLASTIPGSAELLSSDTGCYRDPRGLTERLPHHMLGRLTGPLQAPREESPFWGIRTLKTREV